MLLCDVSLDVWSKLFDRLKPRHCMRLAATGDTHVLYALANASRRCELMANEDDGDTCAPHSTMFRTLIMGRATHLSTDSRNFAPSLLPSLRLERLVSLELVVLEREEESWTRSLITYPEHRALLDLANLTPNLKSLKLSSARFNFYVRLPTSLEVLDVRSVTCSCPLVQFVDLCKLKSISSLSIHTRHRFLDGTFHNQLPPNTTSLSVPVNEHVLSSLKQLPATVKRLKLRSDMHVFDLAEISVLPLTELVVQDGLSTSGTRIAQAPPTLTRLKIETLLVKSESADHILDVCSALPASLIDFSVAKIDARVPQLELDVLLSTLVPRMSLAGILRLLPSLTMWTLSDPTKNLIMSMLKSRGASQHRMDTAACEWKFASLKPMDALWHGQKHGLSEDDIRELFKRHPAEKIDVARDNLDADKAVVELALDACRLSGVEKVTVGQYGVGPLPDEIAIKIRDLTVEVHAPSYDLAGLLSSRFVRLRRLTIVHTSIEMNKRQQWTNTVNVVSDHLSRFEFLEEVTFTITFSPPVYPDLGRAARAKLAKHKFVQMHCNGTYQYCASGSPGLYLVE